MKIGIMGLGAIAEFMAKTLNEMQDAQLYAVGSRDLQKAQNFANKYGAKKAYGSYEDLVKDEDVELIYIATPHSHHYENAMLSLKHGKAVLCEKSFMVNAKQTQEVLDYAKANNIFITEGIWTRYMPSCAKLKEIINSGVIGKISSFTANLGYNISDIPRIKLPELAGGALLDVGIYTIQFASAYFGNDIDSVISTCDKNEHGVDLKNSIILKYKNGITGIIHSNTTAVTDQIGAIHGEKGYIIATKINNITQIEVYLRIDKKLVLQQTYTAPKQITGYEYQVQACIKAMREGKLECDEIPHSDTLSVMQLMDNLRKEWGIVYPFE